MKLRCCFLSIFLLLVALDAAAQDLATIVGTITDTSNAAIPGAKITVDNRDKGFNRAYVSDAAGQYTAAKIPLGNYVVTAEDTGFKTEIRTGIALDAGQTQRVDFVLAVGSTRESVTINGNVPKVETESGTLSSVITSSQVTELNLVARTFTNLALLVPGAAPDGGGFDPSTVSNTASYTLPINGVPGNFNNWEVDGVTDVQQGSNADDVNVEPNLDMIAEFRISTSDYSAEFPKSAGANIEVITKSGTSQFHGSAFDFVRNDIMDANDFFINRTVGVTNAPKTPLKRNDFGFTVGGPLYIPNHYNTDKQKTFFFVSEEWRRNRDGEVYNTYTPSTLERAGDFSQCDPTSSNYNPVVASGCALPISPTTGTPVDTVPVDPTAATLIQDLVALPNSGPINYVSAPESTTNSREDSVRIDQNINDKSRIFARWTQDAYNLGIIPGWAGGNYPTVRSRWIETDKSGTLHLTQSLRPDLLNEVIVGYSLNTLNLSQQTGVDSPGGTIDKPTGFVMQSIFPLNQSLPLIPGFYASGGVTNVASSFGQSTGYIYNIYSPLMELKDNVVWTRAKHIFKAGFFLGRNDMDNNTGVGGGDPYGLLNFSSSSSVTTGNALADMFLGRIGSYTEYGAVMNGQLAGGYGLGHWRQWDFEPYFQDDWRVSSRLTLNLGLRYFDWTPWADKRLPNLDSVFIPSQYNSADQAQLNSAGYLVQGTGHTYLTYGNGLTECGTSSVVAGCSAVYKGTFSPRFGFAWTPTASRKTSIRGGYALVWDSGNSHQSATGRYGKPPTVATITTFNVVGFNNIVPGPLPTSNYYSQPLNVTLPEINQYNLTIDHEFPGNNLITVGYVGSLARHLERRRDLNQVPDGSTSVNVPALAGTTDCDASGNCNVQASLINNVHPTIYFRPYRGFTTMDMREYTGDSRYNSLQINFRHTTGYGLTFQAAYTYAHTLDNVWGGGGTGAGETGIDDSNEARWWGTSSINQTQVLVMNYIYSLPFFSHSSNRWLRSGLGGWQVNGITTFSSGPPLETNCGISGYSSGIGEGIRCDTIGKVRIQKSVYDDPTYGPTPTWYDPGSIAQPTLDQLAANGEPGMFGYMGKNALTGPGRNDWDLGLTKNFELPWFGAEQSNLQLRWETFNTFNHPNWSGVNYGCSSLTAPGEPCTGANNIGNGEVTSAHPPRVLQLALRFVF